MARKKHAGPMGAPCPGCRKYLTMRDAEQVRAASQHHQNCPDYQRFLNERKASS